MHCKLRRPEHLFPVIKRVHVFEDFDFQHFSAVAVFQLRSGGHIYFSNVNEKYLTQVRRPT